MSRFHDVFGVRRPIIGVIHLPPLPGYEASPGLGEVLKKALRDLSALEHGGAHGALIVNDEDHPHTVKASPETIATMTRVTGEMVHAATGSRIGIQLLLNDPHASLAVARTAGASFIRTDYFVDPMARPEYGPMAIDPAGLIEYRDRIDAHDVLILADIQVKYARLLETRTLAESAGQAMSCAADAVLVTGTRSGEPPTRREVVDAKRGAGRCPVLIGSGLDLNNLPDLLSIADGAVVGTSLKTAAYVDPVKVGALMRAVPTLDPS